MRKKNTPFDNDKHNYNCLSAIFIVAVAVAQYGFLVEWGRFGFHSSECIA